MNERALRRLFHRILVTSVPVAAALACGGASTADGPDGGEVGQGGTAGNGGLAGSAGSATGGGSSGQSGSGTAGKSGSAGAGGSAGTGGRGGSGGAVTSSGQTGSGGKSAMDGGATGGSGGGVGQGPCSDFVGSTPCRRCVAPQDGGPVAVSDGGAIDCASVCGLGVLCSGWPVGATPRAVICDTSAGVCNLTAGRRPAGLAPSTETNLRDEGDFFAEMAWLEAASVAAFQSLRDELVHHGAPRSLVRAAERAARDEVRHARVTGALARRYGSQARSPRVERRPIRSLREIAIENATEGCVRETFGALVATHQARAAKSKIVRSVFARIAEDETRHAVLAWKVAAWLDKRLDDDARASVLEARRRTTEDLVAAEGAARPAWAQAIGLPGGAVSVRMLEGLTATLWS